MLFGVEDWLFLKKVNYGIGDKYGKDVVTKEIQLTGSKKTWIGFLTAFAYDNLAIRSRLLPKAANKIMIRIPHNTISSDPKITKSVLERIIGDANITIRKPQFADSKISVLGASLGGVPAFVFANTHKLDHAIFLTPGFDFVNSIWRSSATRRIIPQEDYTRMQEYDSVVNDLSPHNNISNFENNISRSVDIHIGKSDKIIPFKEGLNVIEAMRKMNLKTRAVIRDYSGHGETICCYKNPY
jgi:hypothetical protein